MIHSYISVPITRTAQTQNEYPNILTKAQWNTTDFKKQVCLQFQTISPRISAESLLSGFHCFWIRKQKVKLDYTKFVTLYTQELWTESRMCLHLVQHAPKGSTKLAGLRVPERWHQEAWWDLAYLWGVKRPLALIGGHQDWVHLIKWAFECIVK